MGQFPPWQYVGLSGRMEEARRYDYLFFFPKSRYCDLRNLAFKRFNVYAGQVCLQSLQRQPQQLMRWGAQDLLTCLMALSLPTEEDAIMAKLCESPAATGAKSLFDAA